jgi:transposase
MVPWANHNSSYTKEFEQQVAYLSLRLNKKEVSRLMRISWNTVGPVLSRTKNIYEPDSSVRFNNLTCIGIDEPSYKKEYKYVTVVTDHDTNQVVWVGEGTGKAYTI